MVTEESRWEAAETHAPEEYPLDCRSVIHSLEISPTTFYKYHLQDLVSATATRQRARAGRAKDHAPLHELNERVQKLKEEVKLAEDRNKHLAARLALVEANAARLGIDPEELYRPVLKPVRTVSHAGKPGGKRIFYASKRD
jgi:hypothetical protein